MNISGVDVKYHVSPLGWLFFLNQIVVMNNSKVQIQSGEIPFVSCYQWSAFCIYGTEATHCLGSIVCIDK